MTHGSLFSGIGGFDLAADWMGWENKFHCEINDFGQKVLKHYWPHAETYTDIKTADFSKWRGLVHVLSGGFPCQPYSTAGKRLGKEDDRHLWPYMLAAIKSIQPCWVVGENVRGLTNWNGGMVFDEVQDDLEAEGYEVLPFLLPACAVNAPHRRDRIWFVAHSNRDGYESGGFTEDRRQAGEGFEIGQERERIWADDRRDGEQGVTTNTANTGIESVRREREDAVYGFTDATNTQRFGQQGSRRPERPSGTKENSHWKASWSDPNGRWPTQSPLCSRNDGLSPELAGITFSKHRNESLKGYGNAVVPQIPYQIFKAIEQYENTNHP